MFIQEQISNESEYIDQGTDLRPLWYEDHLEEYRKIREEGL